LWRLLLLVEETSKALRLPSWPVSRYGMHVSQMTTGMFRLL
jgi:hypothetical protein